MFAYVLCLLMFLCLLMSYICWCFMFVDVFMSVYSLFPCSYMIHYIFYFTAHRFRIIAWYDIFLSVAGFYQKHIVKIGGIYHELPQFLVSEPAPPTEEGSTPECADKIHCYLIRLNSWNSHHWNFLYSHWKYDRYTFLIYSDFQRVYLKAMNKCTKSLQKTEILSAKTKANAYENLRNMP